jgi:hypothetical protein
MDIRIPYFIILFAGVIIGIIRYKKFTKSIKNIFMLLVFTFLFESFSFYLTKIKVSNYVTYNLFIVIQFTFISYSFYNELTKKWILTLPILLLILFICYSYFFSISLNFFTHILIINLLITSYLCLYFLINLLKIKEDIKFQNFPFFWISTGFLIFSSLNIVEFGVYNFVLNKNSSEIIFDIFDNIRTYSNYLLYLLILVSFFVKQHCIFEYEKSRK